MKVTIKRVSRYLNQVKTIVGYLLKMRTSKDREILFRVTRISLTLFNAEKELRSLQEYIVKKGETDG